MALYLGSAGTVSHLTLSGLNTSAFGYSCHIYIPTGLNPVSLFSHDLSAGNRLYSGFNGSMRTELFIAGTDGQGSTLVKDRWYHIGVRKIAGVGAEMYVDGVLDITVNNAATLDVANVFLGADHFGDADRFNGYVDNFILWNGATPDAEELKKQRFQRRPVRWANLHSWLEMKPGAQNFDSRGGNTWSPTGTILDAPAAPVPYSLVRPFVLMPQPASGGTTYTQSIAGAMTPTGTLLKQDNKVLSGALTFAGVLTKQPRKVLAGAVTPSATVIKQTGKPLAGSMTPSATLTKRIAKSAFTAALSLAGTLSAFGSGAVALLPLAGTILDALVYGAQLADMSNYASSIGDEANFTGSTTINPDH